MASWMTLCRSIRCRKSGVPSKWHTIELDGHSIPALQAAFAEAAATKGKPTAIIAHTIKGKGVSFMENNPKFHGTAPTQEEMEKALMELA